MFTDTRKDGGEFEMTGNFIWPGENNLLLLFTDMIVIMTNERCDE